MKLMGRDEIPEPDTVGNWLRRVGDPGTRQPGSEGLGRVMLTSFTQRCRFHFVILKQLETLEREESSPHRMTTSWRLRKN